MMGKSCYQAAYEKELILRLELFAYAGNYLLAIICWQLFKKGCTYAQLYHHQTYEKIK